jgi:release factor glutamine methyltransferase
VAAETVGELLMWGRTALLPSRTASLDAQLLLADVLHVSRAWVLAHSEARVAGAEIERYRELVGRRVTGVPLAYLRGRVEWFGMDLEVSPAVLVPRPDTEVLAEEAIEWARAHSVDRIADIGTGSGALAIALARFLPDAVIVATDVSEDALEIARHNAAAQGAVERITFRRGDLLNPLKERPDMLVANLPYLSDAMMAELDADVRHEPVLALHGGATGLELYDRTMSQMRVRGWTPAVFFEIDPRQETAAVGLAHTHFPGARVRIVPDLARRARVLVIEPEGLPA